MCKCLSFSFEVHTVILEIFPTAFILGRSLYLRIDFKTGSLISLEIGSGNGYSGILRLLMMVEKKVFKAFAVLVSVLMILSFSITVIFSSNGVLSNRKGLTVFQKFCCLWFSFYLNYCNKFFLDFLNNETQQFRCFEYFLLFSSDLFLKKLFRSRVLCINSFESYLFMNGR